MILLSALLLTILPSSPPGPQDAEHVERYLDSLLDEDGLPRAFDENFPELAKLGWTKVVPTLSRIVSEKSFPYRLLEKRTLIRESYVEQMRALAISALGKSGDVSVIGILKEAVKESEALGVKESALAALYQLGEKTPLENAVKEAEIAAATLLQGASKERAPNLLFGNALLLARIGKRAEAEATHRKIVEVIEKHELQQAWLNLLPSTFYNLACLCALRSDKAKALEWLEKAVRAGFKDRAFIRGDRDFDSLKDDEAFQKLLADDALFGRPEKKK